MDITRSVSPIQYKQNNILNLPNSSARKHPHFCFSASLVGTRLSNPYSLTEKIFGFDRRWAFAIAFYFHVRELNGRAEDLIPSLLPLDHSLWKSVLARVAATEHRVDLLYPTLITKSPLSFAVFAGCKEVSRTLLETVASPLGDVFQKPLDSSSSSMHFAVSLHQTKLFLLL